MSCSEGGSRKQATGREISLPVIIFSLCAGVVNTPSLAGILVPRSSTARFPLPPSLFPELFGQAFLVAEDCRQRGDIAVLKESDGHVVFVRVAVDLHVVPPLRVAD